MNRNEAKRIAEKISNTEIQQMFDAAKAGIKDWTKTSIVNKGMTKDVSWNILAKDFDPNKTHHILAKTNMVREFGEYLPGRKEKKHSADRIIPQPVHQDPIF